MKVIDVVICKSLPHVAFLLFFFSLQAAITGIATTTVATTTTTTATATATTTVAVAATTAVATTTTTATTTRLPPLTIVPCDVIL